MKIKCKKDHSYSNVIHVSYALVKLFTAMTPACTLLIPTGHHVTLGYDCMCSLYQQFLPPKLSFSLSHCWWRFPFSVINVSVLSLSLNLSHLFLSSNRLPVHLDLPDNYMPVALSVGQACLERYADWQAITPTESWNSPRTRLSAVLACLSQIPWVQELNYKCHINIVFIIITARFLLFIIMNSMSIFETTPLPL